MRLSTIAGTYVLLVGVPAVLAVGALALGLDIGVLSPTLFALMVLMALVTTAMTTPLLDAFQGGRRPSSAAAR